MKWVLFGVVALLVAVVGGAAMLPMSVAANLAAERIPDLRFSEASGSVWNGRLTQVRLGGNDFGDVSVRLEPMRLLGGSAAGRVGVVQHGFSGQGEMAYSLTRGELVLSDVTIEGPIREVMGLPSQIRETDGRYSMTLAELRFTRDACANAAGEVWTDAMARLNFDGEWAGPELRGPVRCSKSGLVIEAAGRSPGTEDVKATLVIGPRFSLDLTTHIEGAAPGAVDRLAQSGFRPEGETMVFRARVGS